MKNKFIAGFVCGAVVFGMIGAFAAQYSATDNPFPVKLNGQDINIEGYNINDETYFKLRDIADAVGGFSVDFNDNTIILTKDSYTLEESKIALTDSSLEYLAEFCLRMPPFVQSDIGTEKFVHDFIFYMHSGTETYDMVSGTDYMWSELKIKNEYLSVFGQDMPSFSPSDENIKLNNGYYIIAMSNVGDERCLFSKTINTADGIDVIFKRTDSTNSDFGTVTCHLKSSDNENGYVITSVTNSK